MILSILKKGLIALSALFLMFYIIAAFFVSQRDELEMQTAQSTMSPLKIAIFGASGTAGDGILKAALASTDVDKIHVLTRRSTPRIEAGIVAGKVQMTQHLDYLDYSSVIEQLADVDAVYWAIGINSLGVDEETYGMIHVDFPMRFVSEWRRVSNKPDASFHYISSSDISENSKAMWAREKVRAENSLFTFAAQEDLRVITYRPDYIGPTEEEAHLGQDMIYWFFKPVGAAVRAKQIGQAMIEVTIRASGSDKATERTKLSTRSIIRYSNAYEHRYKERETL